MSKEKDHFTLRCDKCIAFEVYKVTEVKEFDCLWCGHHQPITEAQTHQTGSSESCRYMAEYRNEEFKEEILATRKRLTDEEHVKILKMDVMDMCRELIAGRIGDQSKVIERPPKKPKALVSQLEVLDIL